MLYIEVLLLAIGLSMDSLAVSVTGGAVLKNNCTAGNIIKIASVLGIFQAGMTVIGYTMGLGFEKYICAFDHWIAFTLLLYLGGKMIYDSAKEEEEDGKFDPLCNRTLCGLGIATSIDALAVGISLAILNHRSCCKPRLSVLSPSLSLPSASISVTDSAREST